MSGQRGLAGSVGRRRPMVVVAVSPRLLADTLTRTLAKVASLEVVLVEPGEEAPVAVDVAVVSTGVTAEASVVVELLDDGSTVVVWTDGDDRIIELGDVAGLVSVLERYLGVDLSAARVPEGDARRS